MKVFIFGITILFLLQQIQSYPTFAEYVVQFQKSYDATTYDYRKALYDATVASYADITLFTPGVNNFTDWSAEEIAALSTNHIAPHQETPRLQAAQKLAAPASLDWRDSDVITSIKDQGSCGSCWAFASAAYAESKLILDGKYNKNSIDLSEQFILKCTTQSDCNGGYMEYAMQTARKLPTESTYPYNPFQTNNGICLANGVYVGDVTYDYYDYTDQQIINLLQKSPVGASISSTGWTNYGSGVYVCPIDAVLDHAILIIGYTPTEWIIKNQWGTTWGENGFIRVTRTRALKANCGVGTSIHIMWQKSITLLWLAALMALIILN